MSKSQCNAKTVCLKYIFKSSLKEEIVGGVFTQHFLTRCSWRSRGMNYFIRPCRCSVLPHAINPYSGADRAVIGQNLLHLSATLFSGEFGSPTGSC